MRHTTIVATFGLIALAGCAQTAQPGASTTQPATVAISQQRVAVIGKAVLQSLEAVASTYVLTGNVPDADKAAIIQAEASAETFVNQLQTATPETLSTVLVQAAQAVNTFEASLPPSRINKGIIAGVTAFAALVEIAAPLIEKAPPGSAPVAATVKTTG